MAKNDGVVKKHSAGGLLVADGKFLIIHWKSQNTYEIPKGTIEEGETSQAACVREIQEETGYSAEILTFLSSTTINYTWSDGIDYEKIIDYYLLKPLSMDSAPSREANEDFRNEWHTYEEAKALLTFDHALEALEFAKVYCGKNGIAV